MFQAFKSGTHNDAAEGWLNIKVKLVFFNCVNTVMSHSTRSTD